MLQTRNTVNKHSQTTVGPSPSLSLCPSFFFCVSLILSSSFWLGLLVFVSGPLYFCLLHISVLSPWVFFSQAAHPLTSALFHSSTSFLCFLVVFVSLLQGLVCDFDLLWLLTLLLLDSVSRYPDSVPGRVNE